MACVAVASLVRTIELEFLQSQPRPVIQELISCTKELVESLRKKLGSLIRQFDENRMDGGEATKHLEAKLRDVAFRVEDEIEFQVVDLYVERPQGDTNNEKTHCCQKLRQILHRAIGKSHPCLKLRCILQQAIEEIDAIKEELVKIKEYKYVNDLQGRKTFHDVLQKSDEFIMMGDSSQQYVSHPEDIMVGKNNDFKNIKKMLIERPSKQRTIVSIKGMGGIGKTMLAKRAYEDPSIAFHFDKRAWVVVSQHHNKRQMLVGLLNTMGKAKSGSDEDLALRLYQALKGQRYLVVMDDVWSGEAWDVVKVCFPDDRNGSRVLLTTRLAEVANHIGCNNDFSHQMHLLNQSESWNLFHEKACRFHDVEFEMIGRPIVKKCKGLPLAIVVVAGLLSKLNTLHEWKNIAEVMNSYATTTIDEECSRIFSLSYSHLPHNLKACFLYFGVFPEDHDININHLERLWSAEGLVKAFENESFDVVAKRYVKELIDRNLILVSRRSRCRRILKVLKMHDLLHAFCVREAQNENLLHVVHENGSNFPRKGFRWLSIQLEDLDIPTLYSSSKNCRSIFYFQKAASLDLKIFNLLRVLYFTNGNMCEKIVDLVHLRYLPPVVRGYNILKLFKAWNLQTLYICAGDERNYLEFPQLQYFYCYSICGHPPKFVHQNLLNVSFLEPYHCTKEFFTNIPYLKRVRIIGHKIDCNDCIDNLTYLQQLERLCIFSNDTSLDMIPINNHIVLLKNLKKLSFQRMRFNWRGIDVLSKLPTLEVLKLTSFACIGEEWELPEKEKFCQLIVLEIGSTDLKHWKASADHFPKLEHLFLFDCNKLEKIPPEFAEISTLKSVELILCLPSVVTSAKQIQNDQRDYGNDNIVVYEKYIIELDEAGEDEFVEAEEQRRL